LEIHPFKKPFIYHGFNNFNPDGHRRLKNSSQLPMSEDLQMNTSADMWTEWLHGRRHGGDPNHEQVVCNLVQKIRDRVLDGANLSAGMVLVDVGSGDGIVAFEAIERIGHTLMVVLTDISEPLLSHAKKQAIELGVLEQCAFIQTSAERLDGVADESADILTTRAALAYVADKTAAARQFYRVLRAGGRISIGEPIYQDAAVKHVALTNVLHSRPADAVTSVARLMQRCRAAQLPSTKEEIHSNPLTNYTERDLIILFQQAGFTDIHMELHIDVRKGAAVPWNTFIDIAPRPGVPTLREVFAVHLIESERQQVEQSLRPLVERGLHNERDAVAYLTAVKPMGKAEKDQS